MRRLWLRPWLWPALWRARRARLLLQALEERKAWVSVYGCDCGAIVLGSLAALPLRRFQLCPRVGCTREISMHHQARPTRYQRRAFRLLERQP